MIWSGLLLLIEAWSGISAHSLSHPWWWWWWWCHSPRHPTPSWSPDNDNSVHQTQLIIYRHPHLAKIQPRPGVRYPNQCLLWLTCNTLLTDGAWFIDEILCRPLTRGSEYSHPALDWTKCIKSVTRQMYSANHPSLRISGERCDVNSI